MSFPCLICGDLPIVNHPASTASGVGVGSSPHSFIGRGGGGGGNVIPRKAPVGGGNGTTIRTLSKDVSDKIFQNLCRHLYIKTEPYWFIQNPGEQMPLCAICSGTVLEIFTLQSKIEQFQAQIKKHVWKVERMVADTEIAGHWMATLEEQQVEESMWSSLPCPPMAIKIARERHYKFRQQILQNFKRKVKLRQKMRATGQQNYDLMDLDNEPTLSAPMPEQPTFDCNGGARSEDHFSPMPTKRSRLDDNFSQSIPMRGREPPMMASSSTLRPIPPAMPLPISIVTASSKHNQSQHHHHQANVLVEQQSQSSSSSVKIPSTISISTARVQNQDNFVDESEYSDSDNNSQVYPDVQIVCGADPIDFLKEEQEQDYSNSCDGDDSTTLEQDSIWNLFDDGIEGDDPMAIPEGEEVVWLAPDVSLRKSFVNKLLQENHKPSVFLRKLTFAVFGLRQLANSSGICGSSKPGSKPSVDRYKFEALREYTVDTYGIRDNLNELDDLNRKIRTICCDARKALKRRLQRPPTQLTPTPSCSSSTSGIRGGILVTPISDVFNISDNLAGGNQTGDQDEDDQDEGSISTDHGGQQQPTSIDNPESVDNEDAC